ncbi:3-isopropylmalate dehydratase, small subunit [Aciduliprofundum sp. MAR08-339]|uniref:LeuD/DmdB family oxidoreductase small subunit n=1 Tax=Aciduliprofundum sp. (strain MAR08-339) TaxID=673860 RepID=UPI0002A4C013|nr:3-isopropylmalate dehydratase, small subunit [Aciduliprofundum sp. MAR08-339]
MKPRKIKGRIWLITDKDGKRIDNIDTDMIFHNRYLYITDMKEMGNYAFSNLPGWEDFPKKAKPGDILVVGRNFGAGSSRQQAVDCFIALGISAIIGESFGAIYKRNVINSGLPLIEAPGIFNSGLSSGDTVEINLETGEILRDGKLVFKAKPMSKVALDIYDAGGIFEYGKRLENA